MPRAVLRTPFVDFPMNVFDLRPRSPADFDAIPLEFFQDYPEPGVNFIDVGCVFDNPAHWQLAIDALNARTAHLDVDFLLAMDARGFMLAGALAYLRGIGFAMARKPGKLPGEAIAIDYRREYGSATIEIQPERIKGRRVLIVDDVLATGGTMKACCELVEGLGGKIVGVAVLTELLALGGRAKVTPHQVHSVLKYE